MIFNKRKIPIAGKAGQKKRGLLLRTRVKLRKIRKQFYGRYPGDGLG